MWLFNLYHYSKSVEKIETRAFEGCTALTSIYCEATEAQEGFATDWHSGKNVYWYSETENKDNKHWRYVEGVPTVWA